MADFEINLSHDGRNRRIGLARSNRARGKETVLFEYDAEWLHAP
jgi:serine/threonine-protein kinase HipA